MVRVGWQNCTRIVGLPECCVNGCPKSVTRRGTSVTSAYCRAHHGAVTDRMLEIGVPWHLIQGQMWDGRPQAQIAMEG